MNRHLREDKEWESVRRVLLDAVGEPTSDELQSLRESVKRRIAGRRKSGHRWWIWNTAAAFACAAAVLAILDLRVHTTVPNRLPPAPLTLPMPVVAPRELTPVSFARRSPHRSNRLVAGIRSVAWNTQSNELKLTTADPNVVILLPMNRESDEHEN